MEIFGGGAWVQASEVEKNDRQELQSLEGEAPSTVGAEAEALSQQLEEAKSILYQQDQAARELFDDVENEKMQRDSIQIRLEALQDDLEKNKDAQKLKSFGSVAKWSLSEHTCPTCHQHITDSLLPQNQGDKAMSIEDNLGIFGGLA